MKVLITGGAGYIGSTVATAGLEAGIEVVLLDEEVVLVVDEELERMNASA